MVTEVLADYHTYIVLVPWGLSCPCRGMLSSGFKGPEWLQEGAVIGFLQMLWKDENGQDIAEYAVMLAVILVFVVGTIRLIGSNANNVFSQVGSAIQ